MLGIESCIEIILRGKKEENIKTSPKVLKDEITGKRRYSQKKIDVQKALFSFESFLVKFVGCSDPRWISVTDIISLNPISVVLFIARELNLQLDILKLSQGQSQIEEKQDDDLNLVIDSLRSAYSHRSSASLLFPCHVESLPFFMKSLCGHCWAIICPVELFSYYYSQLGRNVESICIRDLCEWKTIESEVDNLANICFYIMTQEVVHQLAEISPSVLDMFDMLFLDPRSRVSQDHDSFYFGIKDVCVIFLNEHRCNASSNVHYIPLSFSRQQLLLYHKAQHIHRKGCSKQIFSTLKQLSQSSILILDPLKHDSHINCDNKSGLAACLHGMSILDEGKALLESLQASSSKLSMVRLFLESEKQVEVCYKAGVWVIICDNISFYSVVSVYLRVLSNLFSASSLFEIPFFVSSTDISKYISRIHSLCSPDQCDNFCYWILSPVFIPVFSEKVSYIFLSPPSQQAYEDYKPYLKNLRNIFILLNGFEIELAGKCKEMSKYSNRMLKELISWNKKEIASMRDIMLKEKKIMGKKSRKFWENTSLSYFGITEKVIEISDVKSWMEDPSKVHGFEKCLSNPRISSEKSKIGEKLLFLDHHKRHALNLEPPSSIRNSSDDDTDIESASNPDLDLIRDEESSDSSLNSSISSVSSVSYKMQEIGETEKVQKAIMARYAPKGDWIRLTIHRRRVDDDDESSSSSSRI
ncbi:hypothetical protein ADUPG1_008189 [Aduncisulcus paluster]|uniref:Uncharacterized protein n=1 Tax=Aduncisulcus paluster TaxID=2918883 RepID=A0ABQ5KSD9_9EUKA|nr:hypothetical protein ADUPG1_008189 [Aduncisulcus paluster]